MNSQNDKSIAEHKKRAQKCLSPAMEEKSNRRMFIPSDRLHWMRWAAIDRFRNEDKKAINYRQSNQFEDSAQVLSVIKWLPQMLQGVKQEIFEKIETEIGKKSL